MNALELRAKCQSVVGKVVRFMKSPADKASHPMLVLRAGDDSIDGIVWYTNEIGAYHPKEGVRHFMDPVLKDPDRLRILMEEDESGVFVESPVDVAMDKTLASMQAQIDELKELVASAAPRPTEKKLTGAAAKSAQAKLEREKGKTETTGNMPVIGTVEDEDGDEDEDPADLTAGEPLEPGGMRDEHGNLVNLASLFPKQGAVDPEAKAQALASVGSSGGLGG